MPIESQPGGKEVAAFIQAIQDNPDDPAPRLAFSDWLAERNHPRALWVRGKDSCAWMLPDLRDCTAEMIEALNGQDQSRAKTAERALHQIGTDALPAVRAWVSEDPEDRWYAWDDFLRQRPPELRSVPQLIRSTNSENWYESWQAIVDLGFHGRRASKSLDLLLELAYDQKWDVLDDIAGFGEKPVWDVVYTTIGEFGSAALSAVPTLASDVGHLESAEQALLKIRPDPLLLLEHLSVEGEGPALSGLDVVHQLDPDKPAAISHAVRHSQGSIRAYACQYLGELKEEKGVPALVQLLHEEGDWQLQWIQSHAFVALGEIGTPTEEAVSALLTHLAKPKQKYSYSLARSLAQLGHSEEATAAIASKLKARAHQPLLEAIQALGSIASCREAADQQLLSTYKSKTARIREEVVNVIRMAVDRLPHDPREMESFGGLIQLLIDALGDASARARNLATVAMASLGRHWTKTQSEFLTGYRETILARLLTLENDAALQPHCANALNQWKEPATD